MTTMFLAKYALIVCIIAFLPLTWPRRHMSSLVTKRRNARDDSVYHLFVGNPVDFRQVFFNSEDLYDNTMESLQWLIGPTDIHRYNIFSPSSSYQINKRYRSDPSVKRYYGFQLWKIHETNMENQELNQFWRLFG